MLGSEKFGLGHDFEILRDRTAALMLAASVALGFIVFAPTHPAFAQAQTTAQDDDEADDDSATAKADETRPAGTASEQKPTDTAEIDANTLDWSQLNVDASTLTYRSEGARRGARMPMAR